MVHGCVASAALDADQEPVDWKELIPLDRIGVINRIKRPTSGPAFTEVTPHPSDNYKSSSVSPGWSAGLGPLGSQWNRRAFVVIGTSLMLAWRARINPLAANSQFSLPYARNQLPD